MNFSSTLGLSAIAATAMISTTAFAGGEHWTDNFSEAQTTAAEGDKDLLLDFTGSDWCGWCIKLNEEVFSHDEFNEFADSNFVLVELDYPNSKELPEEVVAQNAELQERYDVSGFPTIILADAAGRPYAQTGYQAGGPEAYVAHLQELQQVRVERDAAFAAAEEAEGLERAEFLHAGLQAVGDSLAVKHYGDLVAEAIELDADNEAGIKGHYEMLALAEEQRGLLEEAMSGDVQGDPEGTIAQLDELLANDELTAPIRQEALAMKSQIMMFVMEDKDGARVVLEEAIAVAPDSEMGEMLAGALERFFGDDSE